jgi:hypothetical protein
VSATEARNPSSRTSIYQARRRLAWCDSYSRIDVLIELRFEMDDDDWHVVLGEEWSSCDNVWTALRSLRRMLPARGPALKMMRPDELAAYDALPAVVEVYRGCGRHNMRGASWSLNRDVAAKFPFYMRYRAAEPRLISATVPKHAVIALKLDRNEAEIITFGARPTAITPLLGEALDRQLGATN